MTDFLQAQPMSAPEIQRVPVRNSSALSGGEPSENAIVVSAFFYLLKNIQI
jgi:hypothetical protein